MIALAGLALCSILYLYNIATRAAMGFDLPSSPDHDLTFWINMAGMAARRATSKQRGDRAAENRRTNDVMSPFADSPSATAFNNREILTGKSEPIVRGSHSSPETSIYPSFCPSRHTVSSEANRSERLCAIRNVAAGDPEEGPHHAQPDELVACPCGRPGLLERAMFDATIGGLSGLDRTGLLVPVLRQIIDRGFNEGAIGESPTPAAKEEFLQRAVNMFRSETTPDMPRKSWQKIAENVRRRCVPPSGVSARVGEPGFRAELERAIGGKFTGNNKCVLLPDGPAAFGKRYRLLAKHPKRIWLSTWHIDNSATGRRIASEIAAAAREGADVRILVDGNVARRETHERTLDKIVAAGGKVAHYHDPSAPLYGLHSKLCVIDDQFITGGMNYADYYSHGYDVPNPDFRYGKWRDTDMLVKGPAVLSACTQFASLWNTYVANQADRVDTRKIGYIQGPDVRTAVRTPKDIVAREQAAREFPEVKTKNADVAFVITKPGPECDEGILAGYCKLIMGAQQRIDIENAYFIQMPPVRASLLAALKRGVRVRIHTNSDESVDEKTVAAPIVETCHELLLHGAEIYLKKGPTVHSKFMQVDDKHALVGSFNINPRSVQYDTECACFVDNADFAKGVRKIFEMDIAESKAKHIEKLKDFPDASSLYSRLMMYRFYNHT